MWLFTKFGFYSIVKDEASEKFKVRARSKQDLQNLVSKIKELAKCKILEWPEADYRYRIFIDSNHLHLLFEQLEESIDYNNFKDTIYGLPDQKDKVHSYHLVWQKMYEYQEITINKIG
jgi:hypothetical protein